MPDTEPLLVDTGRGFSIRAGDRWLYSSRAPEAAPLAAARAANALPETLYLIPSPCLWHGAAELLGRLPPSSALLGVEAVPGLLELAAARLSQSGLDAASGGRVALARLSGAVAAYRGLEAALGQRFRRVVAVRLSAGAQLDEAAYRSALAAVEGDISLRFRNRLSLIRMGRLWTRNVIANLGSMDWTGVGPLRGDGRPVVVCGAGPSLDLAAPAIRARRDELFVLACDTASGALELAGVTPDAVACLEGQIYNLEDFLPLGGRRPRLAVDLSAHPSTFRAATGGASLVLSEYAETRFLSRLARAGLPITAVPPLGSVGVLAIRLAATLGGPVLLAGLDFAFEPGRTHCAASPADLRSRRLESRLRKADAAWAASFRDGVRPLGRNGSGLTDPALSMYAELAASELSGLEAYDLRFGRGAPLPALAASAGGLSSAGALSSADDIIGEAVRSARARAPGGGGAIGGEASPDGCRRRALAFLRGELELAEAVAEALRGGSDEAVLRGLLLEADFMYCHFPDPERVVSLEDDALRRVAAEAAYWRGRLEAAIGSAEGRR